MKHLILGTAGHIDHGKTSLVRALTGIDTDRLKEEKARGITIELGFAHLELSRDITFGIVDVPGHEKFVRAMVAGVGGMDVVMLVIAADEGIMPQTREHLDILRLLGVKSGLVALTKSDMVDKEWLELVTEETREFVAGSFLENTPIVPVSARTGAGLDVLKKKLALLADVASEKRREGHFRLPVDRVFTVAGFGTVVTGTLLSGEIAVGNELALLPTGREGRVRSIQAHGCKVDKGAAGQRLAVNLQGVDLDEVRRGDVVTPRGVFQPTRVVDARLDYLHTATRELKHRAGVRLHSATYDVQAQVILLDRDALRPGDSAYVQLRLNEPVLLISGDSYILRTASPATTVGGGVVLDPFPPRRRRRNEEAIQLLASLDGREDRCIISLIVGQSLLSGISFEDLLLRSGIPRKPAEAALAALLSSGDIVQMAREPRILLGREAFATLKKVLLDEVATYVTANPLKNGIGKEELKTRLPQRSDQRFYTPLLLALEHEGKLLPDRDIVKLTGQISRPTRSTANLGDAIILFLQERGIEAPTVKEIMERLRCDEKCVRDTMAMLTRNGDAVRVSHDLFYAGAVLSGLRDKLVSYLQDKGGITPPEYRNITGLSRKYLIPLLEYFDSEKVTIRLGDSRVLRKR
ncbi:selenocysteine-specific translation elongation factor [Oryzomonas sagensis]|uniref:Selenocysteine-specific elongation factor n=1 Tax=Oryzomonas sagensis TaxID=2603857 RepID=A0ABQ6TKV7_9BACT|nr:selenocysteine-specific translation elongation factor [Oryzomonas sagensis]KAB0668837.1 selenocysteine-specific translation elongation factor [Oryzomonas sagensis]